MYQPMLYLHWKQVRMVLIPFIVASFGLPLLAIQGVGIATGFDMPSMRVYQYMSEAQFWLPFFPALAALIGVTLALTAWNWDHRYNHVYALSLPLKRSEYTMLKMGAGVTLALLPVAAFWIGSHLAAATVQLPAGLQAYPNHIALRFFMAVLISYALLFAMAAGTMRTTLYIVSGITLFVVGGNLMNDFLANYYDFFTRVNVVEQSVYFLLRAPGPFAVFTGNWNLIDV